MTKFSLVISNAFRSVTKTSPKKTVFDDENLWIGANMWLRQVPRSQWKASFKE